MPSPEGKKELDAALERARIAREKYLQEHPPQPEAPQTLEEKFGKDAAARMRGEAKAKERQDGLKD